MSTPEDLIKNAWRYLSTTHKDLKLHDYLGDGLTCEGCRLLGQLEQHLFGFPGPPGRT